MAIDGGTESIRACIFDTRTGLPLHPPISTPYPTHHPSPGHAIQSPSTWYASLCNSARSSISNATKTLGYDVTPYITGVCVDTTCCTVVFLDDDMAPLGDESMIWMDVRSKEECQNIIAMGGGDERLKVNSGGEGPVSAEWFLPKCMWYKSHNPTLWPSVSTLCEYQDYLNYKLTGKMVGSTVNAAVRWHGDGRMLSSGMISSGLPTSLWTRCGMKEMIDKVPKTFKSMGEVVGEVQEEASEDTGIRKGTKVIQGGPDAFVGMVGLGCIRKGQLCLITGSSHLHCAVTGGEDTGKSFWGPYKGAPLRGVNFAEGGQSSTGSVINWARRSFFPDKSYKELDSEADTVGVGSGGLLSLTTFQGSRTPVTDPKGRGALIGLTLGHERKHIWRSLLEGVAMGTRDCVEGLARGGHKADEIVIAGGATRSEVWLRMHADATGCNIVTTRNSDAPLLGCAILASKGVGVYKTVEEAVEGMVVRERVIKPDERRKGEYDELYKIYKDAAGNVRDTVHRMQDLRGGGQEISPSLLSADWTDIKNSIAECEEASVRRVHCDVFDGVEVNSPKALTFGPKMISDIRKSTGMKLDVHLVTREPGRYVEPMGEAGANCLILQFESFGEEGVVELKGALENIKKNGMERGISIAPKTPVESLGGLLEEGVVEVVDVLTVEPCFAAQKIQLDCLDKVKWVKERFPSVVVMVDGGVNSDTIREVKASGADVIVSGSFIFKHAEGIGAGLRSLKSA